MTSGRQESARNRLCAVLALAALLWLSSWVSSCTGRDNGRLTVGVKFDQPGLSVKKPDGTLAGFDVDVARYVAGRLEIGRAHV